MNKLDFSLAPDSADSASGNLLEYRTWRRAHMSEPFASFVELHPDVEALVLIELATVDLINQISAGIKVRAESYIECSTHFSASSDYQLDLIDAEICARSDVGEKIQLRQLTQRFPGLSDDLQGLLKVHQMDLEASDALRTELDQATRFKHYVAETRINASFDLWHGTDETNDQPVLIFRFAKPQETSLEQVARTLERRKRLRHPNIVRVDDSGYSESKDGDEVFLVANSSETRTLKDVLDDPQQQPFPEKQIARWAVELFSSLEFANRNLKTPVKFDLDQILLLNRDPEVGLLPAWVAVPEDWIAAGSSSKPYSEENTIRSLGLLLFAFCLQQTELGELENHLSDGFSPIKINDVNPAVSAELSSIYLCCVHPKRKNRYASVPDAIQDLNRFAKGESISATRLLRKWF